jgi:hypothetical protein
LYLFKIREHMNISGLPLSSHAELKLKRVGEEEGRKILAHNTLHA